MRKRKEAVDEQVKKGKTCDVSQCPFHNDIQNAIIENRNKPKFTFEKPKCTFGKAKKEHSFSFGKNEKPK